MDGILLLLGIIGVPPLLFWQLKWVVFSLFLGRARALPLFLARASGIAAVMYVRFVIVFDSVIFIWGGVRFLILWLGVRLFLPT